MPGDTGELLKLSLSTAVPLWIAEFKNKPWSEIMAIAADASQFVAEHGDDILFKSKKRGATAAAFNHLAKGVAALSFVPGGVTLFGLHFEARHEGGESAVAASRPRNITFEKGTVGRIVLTRGIRMEATPAKDNPLLGDDPWKGMARHFQVRFFNREGGEISTSFSMGVGIAKEAPEPEMVLMAMADDALDAERAQGSAARYADLMGYTPDDPAVEANLREREAKAAELRAFLGDKAYEDLLEIAEGNR